MLVWFPEGTRSKDGDVQPFRAGIGQLAKGRQIPIVPARIEGTHGALPADRWVPKVRRLRLTIGEPADPQTLEREGKGDDPADRIASALHARVRRL